MGRVLADQLLTAADAKRERLLDLVSHAVRIASVTGSEGAMAAFFERECHRLNLEVDAWSPDVNALRRHPAFVPVEYDYTDRKNVVGTRRGTGGGRNLVLWGHVDTVPVDTRTHWTQDPFGGAIVDDRIYGRGAVDMKGGCCVALAALEILHELDVGLHGDVSLHYVLDEEGGGNGTLAAVLRGAYEGETACIMLEQTTPQIIQISSRGAQFFRVRVHGQEGGVEYHRDLVSAIDPALTIYSAVKHYALVRESRVNNSLYSGGERTKLPTAICRIEAGDWPSTVPGGAVLEGTIECLPGEDIEEVVGDFETYLRMVEADDPWLRSHPFEFERFGLRYEAAQTPLDHAFVALITNAAQHITGHAPAIVGGGGCDLRLPVLYAGVPTVRFGPGGSPIHCTNEWVSIDQMIEVLKCVLLVASDWCE